MAKPVIRVEGMRELSRSLKGLDTAIKDLSAANLAAAQVVEKAAVPLTPKRTGRLRQTLRSSGTKTGGRVRAGKKAVPYAGVIHFGSPKRGIRPRPFLYDAADQRRGEVVAVFENRVSALIRDHDL